MLSSINIQTIFKSVSWFRKKDMAISLIPKKTNQLTKIGAKTIVVGNHLSNNIIKFSWKKSMIVSNQKINNTNNFSRASEVNKIIMANFLAS